MYHDHFHFFHTTKTDLGFAFILTHKQKLEASNAKSDLPDPKTDKWQVAFYFVISFQDVVTCAYIFRTSSFMLSGISRTSG